MAGDQRLAMQLDCGGVGCEGIRFEHDDGVHCLSPAGGYGYMLEYPISRYFVDARVQRIYGGTSEIMKEVIARSMLGR